MSPVSSCIIDFKPSTMLERRWVQSLSQRQTVTTTELSLSVAGEKLIQMILERARIIWVDIKTKEDYKKCTLDAEKKAFTNCEEPWQTHRDQKHT